ncbi:retrotransposon protein [Cucumis melo var. makuwa]|uniref:Retrotransposon protein n=1 Tax=Cucumis melo var. makuwa TaxID=1194695 RepID=A0A5A7UIL3_CUCMM|nr:retrotransposon protein [Cucumis melo var. makuwa]TYJ96844.1 retrotransposon protein [Cucumis melo var. makuwa]
MMAEKLPECRVRATTVIDCRIKTLKRTFQVVTEMRGPACSDFSERTPERIIFVLRRTYICVRSDRATGRFDETLADVGSNESSGYEGFDMANGNEEFLPLYSQGIDLSQDDVRASRPSRALEGRTGSSGSKRKRESQREVDVEGIHLALDQTNEQLRMIAEWPARVLANENHVRTKFFRILREMPELTSLDRELLQRNLLSRMDDLRGFILMPEDEREGFCRVLLRDMTR